MVTSGFGSIWGWVESVHMVACQRKQTDFAGIGEFPKIKSGFEFEVDKLPRDMVWFGSI